MTQSDVDLYIDALFGVFALPWLPWALSALILLAAFAIWADFRHRLLRPIIAGLDSAIDAVEQIPGPSSFRQRYSGLFKSLAENPVIGEGWRAYAPTLAEAPGNIDAIGYSRRPSANLNDSLLPLAGVNLRFYHAVPNYLVGSGLFFTFIGLFGALYFASAGVAAADVQEAQSALRNLLAAATFKFVTSIAGLGASIVFSWKEKKAVHEIGRRMARLCAALEARMVPVTPEAIASEQLAELRRQGTLLRQLSRNIFVTVPQTIEERLAEEMSGAIQPMRDALAQASHRLASLGDEIAGKVDAALTVPDDTGDAGASGPGLETGRLVEEIRALRESLDLLPDRLPQAGTPAGAALGSKIGPVGSMPALLDLLERSAATMDSVTRRIDETLARLRSGLDALSAAAPTGGKHGLEAVTRLIDASHDSLLAARREADRLGLAFRALIARGRQDVESGEGTVAIEAAVGKLGDDVRALDDRIRSVVDQIDAPGGRATHAQEEVVRPARHGHGG